MATKSLPWLGAALVLAGCGVAEPEGWRSGELDAPRYADADRPAPKAAGEAPPSVVLRWQQALINYAQAEGLDDAGTTRTLAAVAMAGLCGADTSGRYAVFPDLPTAPGAAASAEAGYVAAAHRAARVVFRTRAWDVDWVAARSRDQIADGAAKTAGTAWGQACGDAAVAMIAERRGPVGSLFLVEAGRGQRAGGGSAVGGALDWQVAALNLAQEKPMAVVEQARLFAVLGSAQAEAQLASFAGGPQLASAGSACPLDDSASAVAPALVLHRALGVERLRVAPRRADPLAWFAAPPVDADTLALAPTTTEACAGTVRARAIVARAESRFGSAGTTPARAQVATSRPTRPTAQSTAPVAAAKKPMVAGPVRAGGQPTVSARPVAPSPAPRLASGDAAGPSVGTGRTAPAARSFEELLRELDRGDVSTPVWQQVIDSGR